MSQVLYIDESNKANKLVGYLNDHQVAKLVFSLFRREEDHSVFRGYWSPLFPLTIVIETKDRGRWDKPWHCGRLYLHAANKRYAVSATIPDDVQHLVKQTITQINAILAFDCTLSNKLRIFAD